jgi:hypothetical protein
MDANRKAWNARHKELRHALEKTGDRKLAVELFLIQHAAVHSKRPTRLPTHSFEDEITENLTEKRWRFIPQDGRHSMAWIIWHLARVEDVTMNLLVASTDQVLHAGDWNRQLQIRYAHTGNGMSDQDVKRLSREIKIKALAEYRLTVGRKTRQIIIKLKGSDYKLKVSPKWIRRVWNEGAMLPSGKSIVDYWANRTIAGLLLMPPTRHCFLHLNEARRIRTKSTTQTNL